MAKNLVIYDDHCPLCVFQMKMITWLDWFHLSQTVPLSSPEAQQAAPGLDPEQLRAAMHVVTPQGKVHRGAYAVRFIALRMPLTLPLGLFLWVPGVMWVAKKVYAWVAANRLILSKVFGCKDACAIMPTRKREGDQLK